MSTWVKLGVGVLSLGAVFVAAVGVGVAVGPVDAPGTHAAAGVGHTPSAEPATRSRATPGGLAVVAAGYALELLDDQLPAGTASLAFRVLGPDGAPVFDYDVEHVEDLHLIAVRRDLSGYQRVHAVLDPDGTWRAPLELTPGSWRVVADFTPSALGLNVTLGSDLSVPGELTPQPLPEPAGVAEVDGFSVALTGELAAGRESELTLSVSRDGRPVTDLQPYLGSYGHLVALRVGDLAYLHPSPAEPAEGATAAPGPHLTFAATAPSVGTYLLFLEFRHGNAVHTATFTVLVLPDGEAAVPDGPAGPDHDHGG
jgi:hypothetical protein